MKITTHKQVTDLWMRSKEGLHNYLRKSTGDSNLSEELTQQVLLKVYKSCCSDKEINNVRSWLFQIARNTMIDHKRIEKRNQQLVPQSPDSNEASSWQDLSEFIDPLINFLPAKYAQPLIMADLEGMKQEDVAKKLDLGLSATKSRIQRARKMLKEEITTCFTIETNKDGIPIEFTLRDNCIPLQEHRKKKQ